MGKENPYFKGTPLEPDVNTLLEVYPAESLIPGTKILYEEIYELIMVKKGSSRFRSVTHSWRRKMEKINGIYLKCVPKKTDEDEPSHFLVLSEDGKVDLSQDKIDQSVSFARRSFVISGTVVSSKLSKEKKETHNFNMLRAGNIMAFSRKPEKETFTINEMFSISRVLRS